MNRVLNKQLAIEKQVASVFGRLVIGAAGAVTTHAGSMGISSIVKESGDGLYTVTLEDAFDKLLMVSNTMNSNAAGGSGVSSVEIANDPATIADDIKAKTLKLQLFSYTGPTFASLVNAGVTLNSKIAGAAGNSITYEITTGATAGAEVVTVVGNAISVQVEDGVSTATQVVTALAASDEAMALVTAAATTGATAQTALAATPLAGGADGASSEANAVSGSVLYFKIDGRRSSVGPA